jgi:alpha-beta hydrolase superfamily lysophospholipase
LNYFDFSKFTYYIIDLRGYGHSSYNKTVSSIQDFAEDVDLLVDVKKIKIILKNIFNWNFFFFEL